MSAEAGERTPLIETVVTTTGDDGVVNCAAMGVRWGDQELVFWPFDATRTLRNLRHHGEAVVHLTDDVLLFVEAALGHPQPTTRPASVIDGAVIEAANSWREVVVTEIVPSEDGMARSRVSARVVATGTGTRQPLGLCRARHAAVEASIFASRVAWLGGERVGAELARLQELVDKTAGPRERAAMGVRWGEAELVFWPFDATRTLRNLRDHGEAVVHLTDDVLLFVQAALGHPSPPMRPASVIAGSVIEDASAWREVVVTEIAADAPRSRVRARVVATGTGTQPAPGLCRARHAAVEASILASRLKWLGADHVLAELDRLQELVDKTAGPRERAAMDYVRRYVAERT